jgi:hypothetical protein
MSEELWCVRGEENEYLKEKEEEEEEEEGEKKEQEKGLRWRSY